MTYEPIYPSQGLSAFGAGGFSERPGPYIGGLVEMSSLNADGGIMTDFGKFYGDVPLERKWRLRGE